MSNEWILKLIENGTVQKEHWPDDAESTGFSIDLLFDNEDVTIKFLPVTCPLDVVIYCNGITVMSCEVGEYVRREIIDKIKQLRKEAAHTLLDSMQTVCGIRPIELVEMTI